MLADVVLDMQQQGEDVPESISECTYSGKFNLRLGEKSHREIALRAAEGNLSINQWVVRKRMANDQRQQQPSSQVMGCPSCVKPPDFPPRVGLISCDIEGGGPRCLTC